MCLCLRWLRLRLRWRRSVIELTMGVDVFKKGVINLPTPGLYTFDQNTPTSSSRVHLRVDEDHSGVMVVDAAQMVHLNQTAAFMAWLILNKVKREESLNAIVRYYKVNKLNAGLDYDRILEQTRGLIDKETGLCPVCDLDLALSMPFSSKLSAPYRMDLAITYRCNNNCAHCYNARERTFLELPTESWLRIIDRLWELRIPHVVFTGGEPTLRDDLVDLVRYAQEKGMVTGINTNARRLADNNLVQRLVTAGLDHVQITVESNDPHIHDDMVQARGAWQETRAGLRNVINSKLYMMTNTTLLSNNAEKLEEILKFLADEKVPTVGLNALIYSGHGATVNTGLKESELPALLDLARKFTDQSGQRLIWYTPTQYCHFNPLMLSLGVKGCTAAYYNMCLEPNGDVLPCQSYYQSVGNILTDSWDSIWHHPLSDTLRNRREIPAGCLHCDFLVECGGGCPLARDHQAVQPIFTTLS
jgi:radical SAM protein with 4Fe4S-binding SPASM domain